LLSLIRSRSRRDPATHCLLWTGCVNNYGYPQLSLGGRLVLVSRLVLELADGAALLPGLHALHRCDQPTCVARAHLYAGDPAQNAADAKARQRRPCWRPKPRLEAVSIWQATMRQVAVSLSTTFLARSDPSRGLAASAPL
jgi:hypothetical protein